MSLSSPGPDAAAPLPVFDDAVFANLRGLDDDGAFVGELIDVFRSESPVRIAALHGFVGMGKLADLVSVAHALKGAGGTLGLPRFAAAAHDLECAGREGRLPAKAALPRLETEYAAAIRALESRRPSTRG
jgi:HPt (histidine-containing phosphotransfer) domain-containing protein